MTLLSVFESASALAKEVSVRYDTGVFVASFPRILSSHLS